MSVKHRHHGPCIFRLALDAVCICLVTSGVIQTPHDWLNKLYSFYLVVVVIIVMDMALVLSVIEINRIGVSYHSLLYSCT